MPRKKTANPQTEVVAIRLTPGELAAAEDLASRNKLPISRSARNLYLAQAAEIEAEAKDPGKCGRCGEPNPHCHYCGAFLKKGESTETHGCQDRIDQLARNLVMTAEEQYREEHVRAGIRTPAEDAYRTMLQAGIDQLEQETMRTLSTILPAAMGRDLTDAERQLLQDEADRFHAKSYRKSYDEAKDRFDRNLQSGREMLRELQEKNPAITDVWIEGENVVIAEDLRQNPNVVIVPPFTPKMTVDPGQPYTSLPDPPQEIVEVQIQDECQTCGTNCWANQWAELKKLSPDEANEKFNELRAGRTLPKDFKRWPEEKRIAWLEQEWPL